MFNKKLKYLILFCFIQFNLNHKIYSSAKSNFRQEFSLWNTIKKDKLMLFSLALVGITGTLKLLVDYYLPYINRKESEKSKEITTQIHTTLSDTLVELQKINFPQENNMKPTFDEIIETMDNISIFFNSILIPSMVFNINPDNQITKSKLNIIETVIKNLNAFTQDFSNFTQEAIQKKVVLLYDQIGICSKKIKDMYLQNLHKEMTYAEDHSIVYQENKKVITISLYFLKNGKQTNSYKLGSDFYSLSEKEFPEQKHFSLYDTKTKKTILKYGIYPGYQLNMHNEIQLIPKE